MQHVRSLLYTLLFTKRNESKILKKSSKGVPISGSADVQTSRIANAIIDSRSQATLQLWSL